MLNAVLAFFYRNLIGAPSYHLYLEAFLALWLFWLIRQRKKAEKKKLLTAEEEETIINAWQPRPLVDEKELDKMEGYDNGDVWGPISGRPGKYVEIDGEKYLNVATHNYLGLMDSTELDDAAEQCIRRYGVGSCGPRGFYGTVDVHIKLEEKIADFLGLEETALYSYGFAAVSSAIPSYAKAGDIIFSDELVSFPIQRGLAASRSTIIYFNHNSWEDLQEKLEEQRKTDKKNAKKAKTIRRFCVVEGIYSKSGTLCPLKEVADLCKQYKVRLFVDETISFGILGKTGRGLTEHLGVDIKDIDFISGSLEHGFASFGGFIVGPSYVVDHQRISGLGYCFSASLPPLLAGAGIKALEIIEQNPDIIEDVQDKCKYMHKSLDNILTFFKITSEELSPLKFLYLVGCKVLPWEVTRELIEQVIIYVKDNYKIALIQPSYLDSEHKLPLPCIRISVNRLLTYKEIDSIGNAIEDACNALNIFDSIIANISDEDAELRNEMVSEYEAYLKAKEDKQSRKAVLEEEF
ncbi:Serine palmitoyltransferase 1 [Orchesella cincta]|uniref:Serine palmitoyltransferase 1 n=1 Tax=Orchesella cincta TaxID=48709 RepID=A0A1D2MI48_ORCCI|nr:Serine palmitoyltransferase 1 [Orchesella cincta]